LAQCEYLTHTPLGGREIAQFFGRHTDGDANDEVNAKSLHDEPVCAMPSP